MPHSGFFDPSTLGAGWTRYERLAALCAQASLTTREAELVLLLCRGQGWAEMGRSTHTPRSNCYRDVQRAVRKIGDILPPPESPEREWARFILACIRNRPGTDRAPLLARDENGEWSPAGRCQLVTVDDLAPAGNVLAQLAEL